MGILSKLFGSSESDYYNEGYSDGGTYREKQPDLDRKGFAAAQLSASEVNLNVLGVRQRFVQIWAICSEGSSNLR